MKFKSTAYLENGLLKLKNSKEATKFCQSLNCAEFTVTFEKKKSVRSLSQNGYYWGCLIPFLRDCLIDIGYRMNIQTTHEYIKSEFNYLEIVNEKTGEVKKISQSTADLTKSEFSEIIERINEFTLEICNCSIPLPNTQSAIDFYNQNKSK